MDPRASQNRVLTPGSVMTAVTRELLLSLHMHAEVRCACPVVGNENQQ